MLGLILFCVLVLSVGGVLLLFGALQHLDDNEFNSVKIKVASVIGIFVVLIIISIVVIANLPPQ